MLNCGSQGNVPSVNRFTSLDARNGRWNRTNLSKSRPKHATKPEPSPTSRSFESSGRGERALEPEDPVADDGRHLVVAAAEAVVAAVEPDVGHRAGDRRRRHLEFVDGAEGVLGARHEQAGQVELGQVLGA